MEDARVARLRMTANDTTNDSGARGGGTRGLMLRVLLVQALTLIALYVVQLRFGIGAGVQ